MKKTTIMNFKTFKQNKYNVHNAHVRFDNDNYFCKLIYKYSGEKQTEWIINREIDKWKMIRILEDLDEELLDNPNIKKTESGRITVYRNSKQTNVDLWINYDWGGNETVVKIVNSL